MSSTTSAVSPIGLGWLGKFLTSSIGRKLVMSLTGLFLVSFLIIHLAGNLQLLAGDGGDAFNSYAYLMTHNPVIKTISYLLYASILLHAVQGWLLWRKNRIARGQGYKMKVTRSVGTNSNAASNMAWLGTIIFIFIGLHMYQFWLQMKMGNTAYVEVNGQRVKDLHSLVVTAFQNPIYVAIYVISMAVIGAHLIHGFWSAFQTLGLNHKKYTPLIRRIGVVIAVVIPAGFAVIPIVMYGQHLGWW